MAKEAAAAVTIENACRGAASPVGGITVGRGAACTYEVTKMMVIQIGWEGYPCCGRGAKATPA